MGLHFAVFLTKQSAGSLRLHDENQAVDDMAGAIHVLPAQPGEFVAVRAPEEFTLFVEGVVLLHPAAGTGDEEQAVFEVAFFLGWHGIIRTYILIIGKGPRAKAGTFLTPVIPAPASAVVQEVYKSIQRPPGLQAFEFVLSNIGRRDKSRYLC
jgi:hypothetical protein